MHMDVEMDGSPSVHTFARPASFPSYPNPTNLTPSFYPPALMAGIAPKGAPVGVDGRPQRVQSERDCLARYYHKVRWEILWGGVFYMLDIPKLFFWAVVVTWSRNGNGN